MKPEQHKVELLLNPFWVLEFCEIQGWVAVAFLLLIHPLSRSFVYRDSNDSLTFVSLRRAEFGVRRDLRGLRI